MGEERYWFEDVPEEHRYWFIVQWGMPPAMESEENKEAKGVRSVIALEDPEAYERSLKVDRRMKEIGYAPGLLDPPLWSDLENRWEHKEGPEYVTAPSLYTTKEAAEKDLREIEDAEPQGYLDIVERYGQADADDSLVAG